MEHIEDQLICRFAGGVFQDSSGELYGSYAIRLEKRTTYRAEL